MARTPDGVYSSNSVIEHIGVQISGSLFQPVITFTSERGYSREAIAGLLGGNVLRLHATVTRAARGR